MFLSNQQLNSDQAIHRADDSQASQDFFMNAHPSFSLQHLPPSQLHMQDSLPAYAEPFLQGATQSQPRHSSEHFSQQPSPFDLHLYTSIHLNRLQQQRFDEYRERVRRLARGESGDQGQGTDAYKIDVVAYSKAKILKEVKRRK